MDIKSLSDAFVIERCSQSIDMVLRLRSQERTACANVVKNIDALGAPIDTAAHHEAVNVLFRSRLRLVEVRNDLAQAIDDMNRYEGECARRGFNTRAF